MKPPFSHYEYLETHLMDFFNVVGVEHPSKSIICSHGDKAYSYTRKWENVGIPFHKGLAIYLLTYVSPFEKEVRETDNGWVDPCQWVIDNKDRFLPLLP